ncbi:MAG: Trk family potassium uptake protein [Chloroflexi bacterium]|nr:Trk family potassium uptake protein [Chloroflexota bacterium]
MILVGAILLTLPVSSTTGEFTPLLDALFTATSAVCVTGLVVLDTGTYWSSFGQFVILLLIQAGGLGFMTSSTLLLLIFGQRVSLGQRLVIREALGTTGLAGLEGLIRQIVLFTLLTESVGAAVLFVRFSLEFSTGTSLWLAVFHSVSAFNNAGFDLLGEYRSLTLYREDALVLLTIAGLFIIGGVGYTFLVDVTQQRSFWRLSLDSKLVLTTTVILLTLGTVIIYGFEARNPETLGQLGASTQLLNAFFHSATPRTAGFNSLDVSKLTENALMFTIVLMFIGAASASTAGGIKVTTFSVLLAAIISTIRGRPQAEAFGREVAHELIYRALTVVLLAVALVMAVAMLLVTTESTTFMKALFESVSAFGTVGLSTGITPELSAVGKLVVSVTMFAGRLGPLTLALAFAQAQRPARHRYASEAIKIG